MRLKRERKQESAHQVSGRIGRVFFGTANGDFVSKVKGQKRKRKRTGVRMTVRRIKEGN